MTMLQQQLRAVFPTLPTKIKDLLLSEDFNARVEHIASHYTLDEVGTGALTRIIVRLLAGIIPPTQFVNAITEEIDVPRDKAAFIAQEVNRDIFNPIKDELAQVHRVEQGKVVATPSTASNTPPLQAAPIIPPSAPTVIAPPPPLFPPIPPKTPDPVYSSFLQQIKDSTPPYISGSFPNTPPQTQGAVAFQANTPPAATNIPTAFSAPPQPVPPIAFPAQFIPPAFPQQPIPSVQATPMQNIQTPAPFTPPAPPSIPPVFTQQPVAFSQQPVNIPLPREGQSFVPEPPRTPTMPTMNTGIPQQTPPQQPLGGPLQQYAMPQIQPITPPTPAPIPPAWSSPFTFTPSSNQVTTQQQSVPAPIQEIPMQYPQPSAPVIPAAFTQPAPINAPQTFNQAPFVPPATPPTSTFEQNVSKAFVVKSDVPNYFTPTTAPTAPQPQNPPLPQTSAQGSPITVPKSPDAYREPIT